MLKEIIDNYESFGDALITEVRYKSDYDYTGQPEGSTDLVEIKISCFNKNRDYERESIQIICNDIVHFNFKKYGGMVNQALLKEDDGVFTLDFYPNLKSNSQSDGLVLQENLSSECIIKCRLVEFKT
ncbi:hypothetical protein [Adhaeribacter soli]|uniref:Uncharacterized protein n=1 Tax=Adhaeribacter soli TaxID=2607655 RepID=A0A5N1J6N8_9BACT|nr:hypothetical protein [Adhaeribacter soli]KAA9345793.1 hypothetical protein F0P94_01530 [Adhaeribacter soli]